jgi:fumarylpyruvate hydrolase
VTARQRTKSFLLLFFKKEVFLPLNQEYAMTDQHAAPHIPVLGGGHFPVRRIYCVGQNYRAHALEMGGDPDRQSPFFFQKPADAIVHDGGVVPYPPRTQQLEYEVELVVAIGAAAENIGVDQASGVVFGYAVGLDMTRRDMQAAAKKAGRPWDMAKGFDHSAPCGAITPVAGVARLAVDHAAIWLKVDGEIRQQSEIAQMIWNVPEIIAELSTYMALRPGDLIYTGTPDKVGPVQRGNHLLAHVDGLAELSVTIG